MALLAWFHQPLSKGPSMANTATSGPSTTRTTNRLQRQYRIRVRQTCYKCQQEGHYVRNCPRTAQPKPIETKMEKMQALLRSMTSTERAKFKQEISPQMKKMQTHLRTMMTAEQRQFKEEISLNATQKLVKALRMTKTKSPTKPLSRETSPYTNQMFIGTLPSRETGPHPNKSTKKLAQALKKRVKHEAKQPTPTPHPDHLLEQLAEALKWTTKTSHPNQSMEKLANALM